MSERDQTITFIAVLRAVACLMVVYCHLVAGKAEAWNVSFLPVDLIKAYVSGPLAVAVNFGFMGVALFFVISGFIITHTAQRETRVSFLVKRAARIYPPLIATVGGVMLLHLAVRATTGIRHPALGIPPLDVILGAAAVDVLVPVRLAVLAVGWTLTVELGFYLLAAALLPLLKTRPRLAVISLLAVSLAVTFVFVQLHVASGPQGQRMQWLYQIAQIIKFVPAFGFGVALYYVWCGRISAAWGAGLIALAYVALIRTYLWTQPFLVGAPDYYVLQAVLALLLFIAALQLADRLRLDPVTRRVADVSYSLYLIHLPFGGTAMDLVYPRLGWGAALAAGLGVSFLLSWLSWRWIETPSRAFARNMLARRPHLRSRSPAGPAAAILPAGPPTA